MTKTISFAKLDFLTMKSYLTIKNIILILFFSAFTSFSGNASFTIGFLMMYATIYASSVFAIVDKNSMDTLYLSLPIDKWNIIIGRYLYALSFQFISGICAIVLSSVTMMVRGKSFSILELLLSAVLCFLIYGIITAFQLPILFKYKYTAARTWIFLPAAFIPVIGVLLSSLIGKERLMALIQPFLSWIQENDLLAVIGAVCIWIIMMLCSIVLSHRFYHKRAF